MWHSSTSSGRRLRTGLLVLPAVLVLLSGCAQAQAQRHGGGPEATSVAPVVSAEAASGGPRTTSSRRLTFTVVGDSITAGAQPVERRSLPGATSWVPSASGEPLIFPAG